MVKVSVALDFSKVFYTIDHQLPWSKLSCDGFDNPSTISSKTFLGELINNFFNPNAGGAASVNFRPLLFVIYTTDLLKDIAGYSDNSAILHHVHSDGVLEEWINNDLR